MIIQDIYGGGIPLKYEEYYDNILNAKVYYKKPLFKNIVIQDTDDHKIEYVKKTKPITGANDQHRLYKLLIDDADYSAKFIYTLSYISDNYSNILRCIYQFGYIDYDILLKKYPIKELLTFQSVDEKHIISYAESIKKTDRVIIHMFNDPEFIHFLKQYKIINNNYDMSVDDIIAAMQSVGFKHIETKKLYGFDTQIEFE